MIPRWSVTIEYVRKSGEVWSMELHDVVVYAIASVWLFMLLRGLQ